MKLSPILLAVALLAGMPLPAAEMRTVEVEYEGGVYFMESEVWFDAGQQVIYDVFRDWDLATEFSDVIVESRNVGPDEDGNMGYSIQNRACILFYCQTTLRNGSVDAESPVSIIAIADPAESDFEISEESWTFRSVDGGTIVHYKLKMKPAFWVPPLIGPYIIKRKLRSDGGDAVDRIEMIAQARENGSD